jgi:hypothetical protein
MKDCFLFTHHPSCMVVDLGEGVIFQTFWEFLITSAGAISRLPCISSCERFSRLSWTYVPTTENGHFFGEFWLIYLFYKTRFGSFKFNFPEFQQLRNKPAKYTPCVVCVGNSNPMVERGVQFSTISANVNKIFSLFLATSFVNYFVAKISCGYGIHNWSCCFWQSLSIPLTSIHALVYSYHVSTSQGHRYIASTKQSLPNTNLVAASFRVITDFQRMDDFSLLLQEP